MRTVQLCFALRALLSLLYACSCALPVLMLVLIFGPARTGPVQCVGCECNAVYALVVTD